MTNSVFRPEFKLLRQTLIEARQQNNLTQTDLAQLLNKPQSYVSKYENGERRLDVIEFLDICGALRVAPQLIIAHIHEQESFETILDKWGITPQQLTDLLVQNPSLRGMLLGYVAELKLKTIITSYPEVSYTTKFDDHDRKRKGDLYIIYRGRAFDIELKSLQSKLVKYNSVSEVWQGSAQVDASDRRKVTFDDGTSLNTTLLVRGGFDVLAVNLYAFEETWRFIFARNRDLPTSNYRGYTQMQRDNLIASLIPVSWPPTSPFYSDLRELLDDMVDSGEGYIPEEIGLD